MDLDLGNLGICDSYTGMCHAIYIRPSSPEPGWCLVSWTVENTIANVSRLGPVKQPVIAQLCHGTQNIAPAFGLHLFRRLTRTPFVINVNPGVNEIPLVTHCVQGSLNADEFCLALYATLMRLNWFVMTLYPSQVVLLTNSLY